jgi:hypothetical protein
LVLPRQRSTAELFDPCINQPHEVAERRCEYCDELGERRDDCAGELSAQDVQRRQLRKLRDLLSAHGRALENAPSEREHVRLAGGIGESLCRRCRIAVRLDECDRGRPVQQREQRLGARFLGGSARERVLDDAEAGAVLDEPRSQSLELFVRQSAVVGDEQRVGRLELLDQLADDPLLLRLVHVVIFLRVICSAND